MDFSYDRRPEKSAKCAAKAIATEPNGIILIDYLERERTINVDLYIVTGPRE